MDERSFQKKVVKRFREKSYAVQVFNDKISIGVPDIFVSTGHSNAWVEFKYVWLPKKDSTHINVKISGPQKTFADKFHCSSVPWVVVVGVGERTSTQDLDPVHLGWFSMQWSDRVLLSQLTKRSLLGSSLFRDNFPIDLSDIKYPSNVPFLHVIK